MINWNWELLAEHDSLLEGPVWTGESLIYNECYKNKTYEYNFTDNVQKNIRLLIIESLNDRKLIEKFQIIVNKL